MELPLDKIQKSFNGSSLFKFIEQLCGHSPWNSTLLLCTNRGKSSPTNILSRNRARTFWSRLSVAGDGGSGKVMDAW